MQLSFRSQRLDSSTVQDLLDTWGQEITDKLGTMPTGGATVEHEDFAEPHGLLLVAYQVSAIGCGGLQRLDDTTAEIKRLFIRPEASGTGHGAQLLLELELENAARSRGYTRLRLDTDGEDQAATACFTRLATGRYPTTTSGLGEVELLESSGRCERGAQRSAAACGERGDSDAPQVPAGDASSGD